MCNSKKDVFDGDIMKSGVIIRHLILPNHIYNTKQVLNDIALKFGGRLVSLMSQYVPMYKAKEMKDLSRKINKREYEKALSIFLCLNLDGYLQEMSSANECFIPNFKGGK